MQDFIQAVILAQTKDYLTASQAEKYVKDFLDAMIDVHQQQAKSLTGSKKTR